MTIHAPNASVAARNALMTSIGKTPVIVSVANRPDIMFLVMGFHLLLTFGSFLLWSAGEEPFLLPLQPANRIWRVRKDTQEIGNPALSC